MAKPRKNLEQTKEYQSGYSKGFADGARKTINLLLAQNAFGTKILEKAMSVLVDALIQKEKEQEW